MLDFDDDVKEVVKHSTRGRTHTDPIRARSPPEVSLGKRRSAAEAVDKIANTSKRLRGDSNDGKRIAYRKWETKLLKTTALFLPARSRENLYVSVFGTCHIRNNKQV